MVGGSGRARVPGRGSREEEEEVGAAEEQEGRVSMVCEARNVG